MAMMASNSNSISGGGGGGYSYSYVTVKRDIKDVKEDIRTKDKANWHLYFLLHEELEEHPETVISINLANDLGLLTGELCWVYAPIKDGFENFKKELLDLKFPTFINNYLKKTNEINLVIHEFPLALYWHYPEETIKPVLVLKFPNFQKNINNYIEVFSSISYLIQNELDLISGLKKLFNTRKNIIDCSKEMQNSYRNKVVTSHRDTYIKTAKEIVKKIKVTVLFRNFEKQVYGKQPVSNQLGLFAASLEEIEDPNERDSRLKKRSTNKLIKRGVLGVMGGGLIFVLKLLEIDFFQLINTISNFFK